MEGGPRKVETSKANSESAEVLAESIERAQELLTRLESFADVEVIGGEAMELNAQAEAIAAELKAVLKAIPAAECIANGLPYHPTDEKAEGPGAPFPVEPDYPLPYKPSASEDPQPVGAEQRAA